MAEKLVKLAEDLANEKALELSEQLGVKVHPIVFKDKVTGEDIIGYLKEPNRAVKMAVLDKSVMGGFSAAQEMLEIILIKEHSNPRIYSDRPEDDEYNIGAVMAAFELVKFSVNSAKKNN
jgi:hypothetical protein